MEKMYMLGLFLLTVIITAIPNIAFPSTPMDYKSFDEMEMFMLPYSFGNGVIDIIESNAIGNDSVYYVPLYYRDGSFAGWLYNNSFIPKEDSPFDIFIDYRFNNTHGCSTIIEQGNEDDIEEYAWVKYVYRWELGEIIFDFGDFLILKSREFGLYNLYKRDDVFDQVPLIKSEYTQPVGFYTYY